MADRAAQRGGRVAADQDRRDIRARGERDRRARRQLDRLAADQSRQERERLVGAAAALGLGDADGLPCLGAMHDAARADAEHDPTA